MTDHADIQVRPRQRVRPVVIPPTVATLTADFTIPDPTVLYAAAIRHLVRLKGMTGEEAHRYVCVGGEVDIGECMRAVLTGPLEAFARQAKCDLGEVEVFLEVGGKGCTA